MIENLIYDVGMHNGDDTAYYLSLGFNVVAIDASPDSVKTCKERFIKWIEQDRLDILNVGIAKEEGLLDFYLNKKDSVWNSFDKEIGTREGADFEVIKIKTTNILNIIKEKGVPFYMKIDIEGHDILCLNSLMGFPEKPKFISAEVNDIGIITRMKDLGYKKFKLISQNCFLPLQLPATKEYQTFKKLRNFQLSMNFYTRIARKFFGSYIRKTFEKKYKRNFKYNHPYGSSGPFGEFLQGNWLSFEDTLRVYSTYKNIHEGTKNDTGYNFWIDVHATE